ncbi:hypothetical protein ScPMuIL_006732 [Solemya velum]
MNLGATFANSVLIAALFPGIALKCDLKKAGDFNENFNRTVSMAREDVRAGRTDSEHLQNLCPDLGDDTVFTDFVLTCRGSSAENDMKLYVGTQTIAKELCNKVCAGINSINLCQKKIDASVIQSEEKDYLKFCSFFAESEDCLKTALTDCSIHDTIYRRYITEDIQQLARGICNKGCLALNEAMAVLQLCKLKIPTETEACEKYEFMTDCVGRANGSVCPQINNLIDYFAPVCNPVVTSIGSPKHRKQTTPDTALIVQSTSNTTVQNDATFLGDTTTTVNSLSKSNGDTTPLAKTENGSPEHREQTTPDTTLIVQSTSGTTVQNGATFLGDTTVNSLTKSNGKTTPHTETEYSSPKHREQTAQDITLIVQSTSDTIVQNGVTFLGDTTANSLTKSTGKTTPHANAENGGSSNTDTTRPSSVLLVALICVWVMPLDV